VHPAWAHKILVCPSSGKDIANGKGVVSDYESEGSRMTNLCKNELKNRLEIMEENQNKI